MNEENPNDIYAVAARIKNKATKELGANLTSQGTMVCNSFAIMIKNFYDFAETMENLGERSQLMHLIEDQEDVPARLMTALMAGVKKKPSA